jgi:hypothetical protein
VVGATWSERLEQAEDVVVGGQATRALAGNAALTDLALTPDNGNTTST